MSMTTNKQTLRIPQRESHNWGQSVMHHCDFCGHYKMTVTNEDGEHSCASCCDAEYVTALTCALEVAIERMEAAERRNAELTEIIQGKSIAWESTTSVYVKFITDERYQKLRPGYREWYKPFQCSKCAAATDKGE